MFTVQTSKINPAEFSRCEDQTTIANHKKDLSPISKTDAAIREHIYHAIWKDDVLRAMEYPEIDVHVKNRIVYLYGHIVSITSRSRVEKALRAIPDILGIKNNLVLDDKLTVEVASSLGKLEHIYGCKFFTGASHGVIALNGIVINEDVKQLAEKCAAENPNVRGVINNVQVSGTMLELYNQPFLQPVIGEIIYFLDGVSGVVKQVIINPNNRRVTEMTIQGQFPDQEQNLTTIHDNQNHGPDKTIVISMNLIRYLTNISGFLTIKSIETTQYQDFNPMYFTSPQPDWKLPYPYCPGDVLFSAAAEEVENQKMVDPHIVEINISSHPTSAKAPEIPVGIMAAWEDDGGQIIQRVEAESATPFEMSTLAVQSNNQKEKNAELVNDSLGG